MAQKIRIRVETNLNGRSIGHVDLAIEQTADGIKVAPRSRFIGLKQSPYQEEKSARWGDLVTVNWDLTVGS